MQIKKKKKKIIIFHELAKDSSATCDNKCFQTFIKKRIGKINSLFDFADGLQLG